MERAGGKPLARSRANFPFSRRTGYTREFGPPTLDPIEAQPIASAAHAALDLLGAFPAMIDAANYSATETLPDGRAITIRAQRPEDRAGLHAAFTRASAESLYHRF